MIAVSKITKKGVKFYWYDDLALEQYTTTVNDLKMQKRKPHKTEPIIVDEEYLKVSITRYRKMCFQNHSQNLYSKGAKMKIFKTLKSLIS